MSKKKKQYRRMTTDLRLTLERLYLNNVPVLQIAKELDVDRSTIYREIKRGLTTIHTSLLEDKPTYSAFIADEKYKKNIKRCGRYPVMMLDEDMLYFIRDEVKLRRSPEVIAYDMISQSKTFHCSYSTIYRYIYFEYVPDTSYKDLICCNGYCKNKKVYKTQKTWHQGKSIELRDKNILKRNDFGHWEMDTVVGKQGISKKSLLVLTERKSRLEIIFKLEEHTANNVVEKIDYLEKVFKKNFNKVFKTFTIDNGTEFSDNDGIEKSKLHRGDNRTSIYYCHAYHSCERGSNENMNRMIRRFVKKGSNFDTIKEDEIRNIQDYINNYPRKMFKFNTSKNIALEELKKLNIPKRMYQLII